MQEINKTSSDSLEKVTKQHAWHENPQLLCPKLVSLNGLLQQTQNIVGFRSFSLVSARSIYLSTIASNGKVRYCERGVICAVWREISAMRYERDNIVLRRYHVNVR